ncbi:17833_t:CDS:2 [Entrophospora sp. SA101]|nr:17833_t:CDS:2 [Entrophospora sp. SA101]
MQNTTINKPVILEQALGGKYLIENTKLKQIIKQNRTTNDPSQSLVSPQTPINGHSGEDDNTDSVNLEQIQNPASQDQESIQKGSFSSDNPTTEVQSAVSSEIVGASTMKALYLIKKLLAVPASLKIC